MPRPLVFSNGTLYVGIDDQFRIRDLFYPHVGLYNHLSGHTIRMGVWVDGDFTWVDGPGWNRDLAYENGSLVGSSRLVHPAYGIELHCHDAVDPRHPTFVRQVRLANRRPGAAEFRLFFTQDLQLAETDIGDTAFYNPFLDAVIHYKGPHWILFGGRTAEGGIWEYATGIKGFAGFEGTWRDAEDGRLSMNPIAQGSVDSTISLQMHLGPGEEAEATYWLACGKDLEAVEHESARLKSHPFSAVIEDARASDDACVEALSTKLQGLPDDLIGLARRSLLVLLAHCDHQGAILAATDSDIMSTNRANYCYTWPRDGAHVCIVLDRLSQHEHTRRFFRFCARMLSDEHPVLLQKYRPDGTLGATWHPWIVNGQHEIPFQEDETASVLHALAAHFHQTQDRMLMEELFGSMVIPMAEFLIQYRDEHTGLPKPSYDLWEERRGVHTYTCAAVVAGLEGAAEIAEAMGDIRAPDYREAASEVRQAILERLYQPTAGTFLRRLDMSARDPMPDATLDSSTLCVGSFGVLDPADPRLASNAAALRQVLWVPTQIGGLARYRDDYYFRVSSEVAGNPWIISTLWLAQSQIAAATQMNDLDEPLELMRWTLRMAGPTQILPEQVHPQTGSPLSVSPLAWSHSEFLKTALDWVERRKRL